MFGEVFRRRVKNHPVYTAAPLPRRPWPAPRTRRSPPPQPRHSCSWEAPIAAGLRDEGVDRQSAENFAGLVVSTIEGALLRARAAGSEEPLDSAIAGLGDALDRLLGAS